MIEQMITFLRQNDEMIVAGAAGTGKTTLISDLIRSWRGHVMVLAPTARAVQRLIEVCDFMEAQTIHSAIYAPPLEKDNNPFFFKTRKVGGRGTLIIVDESSMVGQQLYDDIWRAAMPGTKVAFFGDQNQLLPVGDKPGVDLKKPDFLLTKVWRNDGGILDFSHAIIAATDAASLRSLIRNPQFNGVNIHQIPELPPSVWKKDNMGAMLITLTNDLRFTINDAVRTRLGYKDRLVPGETLLVKSNHSNLYKVNGELLHIRDLLERDPETPEHFVEANLSDEFGRPDTRAFIIPDEFKLDSAAFRKARKDDSIAWRKYLRENEVFTSRWKREQDEQTLGLLNGLYVGPSKTALHVQYGYCLTCHAAQGGEANKVGVVWQDDWMFQRDLEGAKRWWYTAVTRARDEVKIWFK